LKQRTRTTVPDYLISDLEALGWKPIFKYIERDMGCFTRVHNERIITSFAQLEVPNTASNEYRFTHRLAVGTSWFTTAFHRLSGWKMVEFPGFEYHPEKRFFRSPEYSEKFVKDISNYLVEWAINLDFREALLASADIPDRQSYPNNSFTYVTAHALLGNIDELENLRRLVESDMERPIVGYVKINHLDNAIECCKEPEKYGLSQPLIDELRGN